MKVKPVDKSEGFGPLLYLVFVYLKFLEKLNVASIEYDVIPKLKFRFSKLFSFYFGFSSNCAKNFEELHETAKKL